MRKKIIFAVVSIFFLQAIPCSAQIDWKEIGKALLGTGAGIIINNAEQKGTISQETANQARYIANETLGSENVQHGTSWQSADKAERVNIVSDISHGLQQIVSKENEEIKERLNIIHDYNKQLRNAQSEAEKERIKSLLKEEYFELDVLRIEANEEKKREDYERFREEQEQRYDELLTNQEAAEEYIQEVERSLTTSKVKIAHINSTDVMRAMIARSTIEKTLNDLRAKWESELLKMQEEYNAKYTEFQQNQETLPQAIKVARMNEIQDMGQRISNLQQTSYDDLQQKQQQLLTPIIEKIQNAINEVGIEGDYTFILELQALLYYSPKTHDITEYVKSKLGVR